jgi:hypothetical protein
LCAESDVMNCYGVCVPDTRGDGTCERWLACGRLVWDGGDCDGPRDVPAPACAAGTLVSCWGTCEPASFSANGACDEVFACPRRAWDGGDCAQPAGATLRGSLLIDDAGDLAALVGVSELQGTITIADGAPASIELPDLVAVQGITVRSDTLETLSLPALSHITRSLIVYDGDALQSVSAPALRVIGGDLTVLEDDATFSVPQLAHVGHSVDVRLDAAPSDELAALRSVGWMVVSHGTTLPALTSVGSDMTASDVTELPALVTVGGALRVDSVAGVDLPALATVGRELTLFAPGSVTAPLLTSARALDLRGAASATFEALAVLLELRGDLGGPVLLPQVGRLSEVSLHGGHLDAPALASVGELWLDGTTVDLPALAVVDRMLWVEDVAVSLPALTSAGEAWVRTAQLTADALVTIEAVSVLPGSVHMAALAYIDDLTAGVVTPDALALPSLVEARRVSVDAQAPVTLAALRWAERLATGGVAVTSLPSLESVGDRAQWPLNALATACDATVSVEGLTVDGPVSAPALLRASQLFVEAHGVGEVAGLSALREVQRVVISSEVPYVAGQAQLPALRRLMSLQVEDALGGPIDLALPALEELGHLRAMDAAALRTVDLPGAAHVASVDVYDAPALERLDLGTLVDFEAPLLPDACRPWFVGPVDQGRGLTLQGVTALTEVSLPGVTWLPALRVSDAAALLRVNLPQVIAAGAILVSEQNDVAWSDITTDALTEPPSTAELDLVWPLLATVDDLFLLHDRRLTEVTLPALTDVTSRLRLHDLPALTAVSMPALEEQSAPGWLNFVNDPALVAVDLPLARVVGRLGFVNTGMTQLDWPGIERVLDHLSVYDNPALASISLPAATEALQIFLDNNPSLAMLDLGALQTVQRLRVDRQGALQTLSLPALTRVDTTLSITGNPTLSGLSLPALTYTAELVVINNPLLSECAIDPVAWGVTGSVAVYDNLVCAP